MTRWAKWRIALIAVIALVAVACGSGDDTTETSENTEATETTEASGDTETPETTEATETTEAASEVTFEGETVRLITSTSGGSGDAHTRLVAEFLDDHLPGNPQIVVEEMSGAGGLIMNNFLWNLDGSEGLTISYFHTGTMMNQALGVEGALYDAADFEFLGGLARAPYTFPVLADSPFETWEDLFFETPRTAIDGAGGVASTNTIVAKYLEWLGADLDVIIGYGGSGDRRLGVESGEIDSSYLAMVGVADALEAGTMRGLLRTGPDHPLLEGLPTLEEVTAEVQDIDDPTVRSMLTLTQAAFQIGASFSGPPGMDPAVAAVYAEALEAVHADPEFQEAATSAELEYEPWLGPVEIREMQLGILDVPQEDIDTFVAEVLGGADFNE